MTRAGGDGCHPGQSPTVTSFHLFTLFMGEIMSPTLVREIFIPAANQMLSLLETHIQTHPKQPCQQSGYRTRIEQGRESLLALGGW